MGERRVTNEECFKEKAAGCFIWDAAGGLGGRMRERGRGNLSLDGGWNSDYAGCDNDADDL